MSLALTICVFFISLMPSVNEAEFLNTTFLLLSLVLFPAHGVTVIVPLTNIYASL